MLKIICLVLYFCTLIFAKTFDCNSNGTIILQKNEIAFFNGVSTKSVCNLTFAFDGNITDVWRYTVIENYTTNLIFDNVFFEKSNEFSYSLLTDGSVKQGFILFEDKNNGCPLESISRNQPFEFTDETQILHIRSEYDKNIASTCNWQFKAPKNYGFKVVILRWDWSFYFNELEIRNKTDLIANERGTYWRLPYYIVGDWINITLIKIQSNETNPFQMYVSVVKQNFTEADGNCKRNESSTPKIWTNFEDNLKNYGNNVRCNFSLPLRPNTELQFYQKFFYMEEGSDDIYFRIDENEDKEKFNNYGVFSLDEKAMKVTYSFVAGGSYTSKEYKITEPNTTVYFEFVSDGSYQFSGFHIEFVENECTCANKEIKCSESNIYGITKDHNGYYCNNMNCNFTILPCKTEYTLLNIEKSYPELNGTFTVFSNGAVVYEMQDFRGEQTNAEIYLKSSNKNKIEIITYKNSYFKRLTFNVKPVNKLPKPDLNIILTPENPSYVIEDGKYRLVIVEMSEAIRSQNFSFRVFQYNRGRSLPIFSDESLTENVREKYCRFDDIKMGCTIPRNKLVIFASHSSISTPTAIQLSHNFGSCIFTKSIFNIDKYDNNYVSAISEEEHECSLTLVMGAYAFYYISEIWTSAKDNETISVLFATDQLYFEFNSKSAENWKNVGFFSKAYTLKIPKKATVFIKFTQYDPIFNVFPSPRQSTVIATPYFGTWNKLPYNETFAEYEIGNEPVAFTVVEYKSSKNFKFYFVVNGEKILVNKTTPSQTFKNQKLGLHYIFSLSDQSDSDHGILFHINVLK